MTDAERACIEALKWYADYHNYFAYPGQGNGALLDSGARAREALKALAED